MQCSQQNQIDIEIKENNKDDKNEIEQKNKQKEIQ